MPHPSAPPLSTPHDPTYAALIRLGAALQQQERAWRAFTKARGIARRAKAAVEKLEGRA